MRLWNLYIFRQEQQGLLVQTLASLTADPGVASWIPALSYASMEIDREMFSTFILLLPLIKEEFWSVTSESMCKKYWLTDLSSLPRIKCG